MTVSPPRRSRRARAVPAQGYAELSDSETSALEDEYVGAARKRGKNAGGAARKRAPAGPPPPLLDSLPENRLFQRLLLPDASVSDEAAAWVDLYADLPPRALKELVNFVLRCCGCVHLVEEHDVLNVESASKTIAEVVELFEQQTFHEYPFTLKKPELKHFKRHCLELASAVVEAAWNAGHFADRDAELGDEAAAAGDGSLLIASVVAYLVPMSTSTLRPLRYVSTLLLLLMQLELCRLAVDALELVERTQRQADQEESRLRLLQLRKKKRAASGDLAQAEKRVEALADNVALYTRQKQLLDHVLGVVSREVFVHRYKDVDTQIRSECLKHLGHWMDTYPEMFFDRRHLGCFGTMLTDKLATVRGEVVRALLRLYKHHSIVPGFRQFTQEHTATVLELVAGEADTGVRCGAVAVCVELARIGFLAEEQTSQVLAAMWGGESTSATGSQQRFRTEVAKLFQLVESERTREAWEQHQDELEELSLVVALDPRQMVQYKQLAVLLEESYAVYAPGAALRPEDMVAAARAVYHLPGYSRAWDFLVDYFLWDLLAVPELAPDGSLAPLDAWVALGDSNREVLFAYITGAVLLVVDEDPQLMRQLRQAAPALVSESGDVADEHPVEDGDTLLGRLVGRLAEIFQTCQLSLPALVQQFVTFVATLKADTFKRLHQDLVLFPLVGRLLDMYARGGLDPVGGVLAVHNLAAQQLAAMVFGGDALLRQELAGEITTAVAAVAAALEAAAGAFDSADDDALERLLVPVQRAVAVVQHANVLEEFETGLRMLLERVVAMLPAMEVPQLLFQVVEWVVAVVLLCSTWRLEQLAFGDAASEPLPSYMAPVVHAVGLLESVVGLDVPLPVRTVAAMAYADLVCGCHHVLHDGQVPGFDALLEQQLDGLRLLVATERLLMDMFYHLEAAAAAQLGAVLQREGDEEVQYAAAASPAAVQELSVYAVKLVMLLNAGVLLDAHAQRLVLNAGELGEVYAQATSGVLSA